MRFNSAFIGLIYAIRIYEVCEQFSKVSDSDWRIWIKRYSIGTFPILILNFVIFFRSFFEFPVYVHKFSHDCFFLNHVQLITPIPSHHSTPVHSKIVTATIIGISCNFAVNESAVETELFVR
jgi:hypothetical protein